RFHDRIHGIDRRHVDDACVTAGFRLGLQDGVEDRQAEMLRAAFARRHAAHHVGAVFDRLLRMEGALGSCEALADHLGRLVDEDAHGYALPCTACTILPAASDKVVAVMIGRPDSCRILRPSSTLVPSRRTTSGRSRPTSRAAPTMPSAIELQRIMPPNTLTRIP